MPTMMLADLRRIDGWRLKQRKNARLPRHRLQARPGAEHAIASSVRGWPRA
jgi:hypothetical protein